MLALVSGVGLVSYREGLLHETIWSPYYKIYYDAKSGGLMTNDIIHQGMVSVGQQARRTRCPICSIVTRVMRISAK